MPDGSQVCPQCAAPVQNTPAQPAASTPSTPPPASSWLNPPSAQLQYSQGQPYPQPGQPYYGQQPPTDGKATASLVFGILSILCFGFVAGIPAIILGHISRNNIQRSLGRLSGAGMAMAGLIMGYISIAFSVLIIAAVMIPNFTRAKITANESAAATTVQTINISQATYTTNYPDKGYAPDLATLGSGSSASCSQGTADHACLLDNILGGTTCTAGAWCTKSGYKFSMNREGNCPSQENSGNECNYVVVATPVSTGTGRRSFCSTSDGVIRNRYGLPLSQPVDVEECSSWSPIR
ncbi:MAG TPA: DUF4190 domain-containing protein [Candidatus Angelobacter sp.]|nr:DUF4190 domain-containing protein [Candidatus Angelobacter sp.]